MTAETSEPRVDGSTSPPDDARALGLRRSRRDRVLAGVCGGIAEAYGSDPTAVRLLAVVIGIFTGIVPMLVIYLVAAVLMPEATEGEPSSAVAVRRHLEPGQGALLVGAVLIIGGIAALARELLRIEWDLLWPIALVGVGGALVVLAVRRPEARRDVTTGPSLSDQRP
jgi:phage shock protein C